jgi:DNA-directed RNA polymerase specialized sigma54-like protein
MQSFLHYFRMKYAAPHIIAQRLEKAFQHRKKLQKDIVQDIVRAVGVHQSQVSRIVRGEFRQTRGHVLEICKFLGVDLHATAHKNPRLASAVAELWDGTPTHEAKLLRVIKAIGQCGSKQ